MPQKDFLEIEGTELVEGFPLRNYLENLEPGEKNKFGIVKLLIERFSKPDDLVVAPLLGSGASLVAAQALGRKFFGVESSLEAFNHARTLFSGTVKAPSIMGGTKEAVSGSTAHESTTTVVVA
jgi:hypothetical protein